MIETLEYETSIDRNRQIPEIGGHRPFPVKVKRILVPTDLTKESDRAIEFGLALAKGCCEMVFRWKAPAALG
jgi:hypothetical protein